MFVIYYSNRLILLLSDDARAEVYDKSVKQSVCIKCENMLCMFVRKLSFKESTSEFDQNIELSSLTVQRQSVVFLHKTGLVSFVAD